MKKYLLLFAAALSMVTMAYGQFEIKAFGGTNFAQLSKHHTDTEWKAKAGYQFGVGVQIGDKFNLEPGVQFVRNSREVSTETADQISKDDIKNAHFMMDAALGFDVFFLFLEAGYEFAPTDYFTDETHDSKHSAFVINAGTHIDF